MTQPAFDKCNGLTSSSSASTTIQTRTLVPGASVAMTFRASASALTSLWDEAPNMVVPEWWVGV